MLDSHGADRLYTEEEFQILTPKPQEPSPQVIWGVQLSVQHAPESLWCTEKLAVLHASLLNKDSLTAPVEGKCYKVYPQVVRHRLVYEKERS